MDSMEVPPVAGRFFVFLCLWQTLTHFGMKKTVLCGSFALLCMLNSIAAYANSGSGKHPSDSLLQVRNNSQDSLLLVRKSREARVDGKISIFDVKTPACEVEKCLHIPAWHPAAGDSIPAPLYEEIAERNRLLGKDSLTSAELFRVLRPGLIWLQYLDPHLRVDPQPVFPVRSAKVRKQAGNIPTPGFLLLDVNDTLVVSRSVDPVFERGDRILAINDVPVSEYLQYCYDDRYIYPFILLKNYHYALVTAADYKVRLERNGQVQEVTTPGMPWSEVYLGLLRQQEFRTCIFEEAKAGYFSITEFYPDNGLLIKKLRKAILQAKKQGCDSFILDLRGNPGGSGSAFDDLLSIFIDKPAIPYLKSQRLKVSKQTLPDYDFLTDSLLGKLIDMPDKYIHREVALKKKMYVPGMRYYVMMDKDTGSVASSFCNIMQYNGAAELVGEPLRHNAMKYGEVTEGWLYLTCLLWPSVSTVEFEEYTEAVGGVLTPDIAIPYTAADYLSGRDAVLDKLLAVIESGRANQSSRIARAGSRFR